VPRGGDVHGALKALIIANEFLERDFGKLLARKRTDFLDWTEPADIPCSIG
jgi:hypothetical protein